MERLGLKIPGSFLDMQDVDDSVQESEAVLKVKIEQQKLLEQLDVARGKYARFVQESEMLKFRSDDTTGMNYFDSIKRTIKQGKLEVKSLRTRFRQNLKTLKTLERAEYERGELCDYEDTDEEMERLTKEAYQNRIDEFEPQIEFESKALTASEA